MKKARKILWTVMIITIFGLFIPNSTNFASGDTNSSVLPESGSLDDNELIDSVILFNTDDIELDIPDENIISKFEGLNGINAFITREMFDNLKTAEYVVSIEENIKIDAEPSEDSLGWGPDMINAERVWGGIEDANDVTSGRLTGQGVRVAILGSGIHYNHPDLNDNYRGGYDFINNDNYPNDEHGHGTKCAGVIAAEDNGVGSIGVAPNVELFAIKVFDSNYDGTTAQIVSGINWAITNNMDVISMSFSNPNNPPYASALLAAYNAGIVLVASTSNKNENTVRYPARLSYVIAVGAISSAQVRASFSNYGSNLDVVAPGVSIYTTSGSSGYGSYSGTSYSCPMVAGVIALMLEAYPWLTPTGVRNVLRNTAIDLGSSGFDVQTGYGMVDALAASNTGLPTTPPAKVTGLRTTSVSSQSLSLAWNKNSDVDIDHYIIYRNGINVDTTSNSFDSDYSLSPSTSYVYQVAAVDLYGLVGPRSNSLTVTTDEAPTIHVGSITLSNFRNTFFGRLFFNNAIKTTIQVRGSSGASVSGVTVRFSLKLNTGGTLSFSETTSYGGSISVDYRNWRLFVSKGGKYTVTVTQLSKSGYVYDSSNNIETSDYIYL
ncbi:MAG: S8 family serine peptidase [archaeon]|nr:S8 family serine peptidase [archaeon]